MSWCGPIMIIGLSRQICIWMHLLLVCVGFLPINSMLVVRGQYSQIFGYNLVPLWGVDGQMVYANEGDNDGRPWEGGG